MWCDSDSAAYVAQEKAEADAAAAEGTSQMWVAQKYIEQPLIINRRYCVSLAASAPYYASILLLIFNMLMTDDPRWCMQFKIDHRSCRASVYFHLSMPPNIVALSAVLTFHEQLLLLPLVVIILVIWPNPVIYFLFNKPQMTHAGKNPTTPPKLPFIYRPICHKLPVAHAQEV